MKRAGCSIYSMTPIITYMPNYIKICQEILRKHCVCRPGRLLELCCNRPTNDDYLWVVGSQMYRQFYSPYSSLFSKIYAYFYNQRNQNETLREKQHHHCKDIPDQEKESQPFLKTPVEVGASGKSNEWQE